MGKLFLSLAVMAVLSACAVPGYDSGINSHPLSEMEAVIWVDPDGCQHWVIDDGVEGYMSPRLRPDGRPYCAGPELAPDPLVGTPVLTKPGSLTAGFARPVATQSSFSYVQVATFADPRNAARAQAEFAALGFQVQQVTSKAPYGAIHYRVVIGSFSNAGDVARALQIARSAGYRDAFATRG